MLLNIQSLTCGKEMANHRSRIGTRRRRSDRNRSLNISNMVRRALAQEILVVEGGRRRKVIAYEAIVRQLSAKVAQGQRKALKVLTQYLRLARKDNKTRRIAFTFEPSPTEPDPELKTRQEALKNES